MDDAQTLTTGYIALSVSVVSIPYGWNISPTYFSLSLFTKQQAFISPLSSFWTNEEDSCKDRALFICVYSLACAM